MRTPASENQDAIALLTKDQLWDRLAIAESKLYAADEALSFAEGAREQWAGKYAALKEKSDRPLKHWPSELLCWLFWSAEVDDLDPASYASEMIHAEMNARGEGERVAV